MPESTLSLQLSDLAVAVGNYLGFGRTNTNWTGWNAATPYVPASVTIAGVTLGAQDTQLGWIMDSIQSGLRQFYFPKLDGSGGVAHKWSFLSPQRTIGIVANQTAYTLPDDTGGIEGEFTYQPADATDLTIRRVGIGQVMRVLQQYQSLTAKPSMCALQDLQSDGTQGQRFQVVFAPTPDATYTLTYQAILLPMALSNNNPYPYGGAAHGETILESVLAVAENRYRGEAQGVHWQAYQERLAASITVDDRDFKPDFLGYNGDSSDGREQRGWAVPTYSVGVLYNGQVL